LADLQVEMKRVKSMVDSLILEELLPKSSPVAEVDLLYRMMRDYPSRPAKGMRPFLCVTTCRAAGGDGKDALLTAACIELFQNWILIHDDIEDGSEQRRGGPALHHKYGGPLALNAGDALHARMWGALSLNRETLGSEKAIRIIEEFSRMINETTEGQHMELGWVAHKRWDLEESDYYEMCTKKTSWYTVASPCRLGAIVAGASEDVLGRLKDFGLKLGVAFQIRDDALNLVGDQKTLILLHLLERVGPDEKVRLISIMNKDRTAKTRTDVSYVLSMIEKHDVVGYARKRAVELMKEAVEVLRDISWEGDAEAAALLGLFAKFAVEREW
jgi:geranylgeranyl diphosphate synthase type II